MTPLEEALAEINKRGSLSPNPSPLGRSTSPAAAQSAAQLAANVQKGFSQYKAPVKSPRRGFGGAFGKFIDIIDTPRAAIASTVQEIVDVFQGEGFSPSDWWKQTKDNHLFG